MKIIHTSDWHLGHTLHEINRIVEQRVFLDWLLATLKAEEADALLIAGDIFDTANPSAEAQELWYEFLGRAASTLPQLQIVAIGGNHDSAARLDAPRALLQKFRVHVVGGLRRVGGELVVTDLVVPLTDKTGDIQAYVAAVPYIRMADLPAGNAAPELDPAIEGVRDIYRQVLDAIQAVRQPHQALIAMGHVYLSGRQESMLSERKILGGNLHALPADIFPEFVTYTALGHLHLRQKVASDNVRYSGAPLPFDVAEKDYPNQIVALQVNGSQTPQIREIPVPRSLDFFRIPERGLLNMPEALSQVQALPDRTGQTTRSALLEVHVQLAGPEPTLRFEIEKSIEGKGYRLVRIKVEYGKGVPETGVGDKGADLEEFTEEEVFRRAWANKYGAEIDPDLLPLFHEIVERVLHQDDGEVSPGSGEVIL